MLRAVTTTSTTSRVIELARAIFGDSPLRSRAAAAQLEALLEAAPITTFATLDRSLRDRGAHRRAGLPMLDLDTSTLEESRRATSDSIAPVAVAALGRSGWARHAAVDALTGRTDRTSVALLITRLTDPVDEIATAAWRAFEPLLADSNAAVLAACLPLLEHTDSRARAGRFAARSRVVALLMSRAGLEALADAARSTDSAVRYSACRALAVKCAGTPAIERVLRWALGDSDPRTRRWAADVFANRAMTPAGIAERLVSLLAADPSPALRLAALRWRARAGDVAALTQAAFDANANVRFFARRFLARCDAVIDYRSRALASLADSASTAELIGALAVLSESGRAADREAVSAFCDDARTRVAAEAARTLSMLQ